MGGLSAGVCLQILSVVIVFSLEKETQTVCLASSARPIPSPHRWSSDIEARLKTNRANSGAIANVLNISLMRQPLETQPVLVGGRARATGKQVCFGG